MAEPVTLQPLKVEYDPITGVPAEFNEYLPKDCEEYKRWKLARSDGGEGALADLTLKDKTGEEIEKRLPGGKVKKKQKAEVVLEVSTRSKKKSVTTVQAPPTSKNFTAGLERFGVKLAEASKLFGKKFASGASITKSPTEQEQIEVQGDFLEKAAELIVKQYGTSNGVKKADIFVIENKKKEHFFDDDSDDEQ